MTNLAVISKAIDKAESRFHGLQLKFESEKSFAIQLAKSNEFLARVAAESPDSMSAAIANVASIGLSLNPAEKQAYLITRTIKEGNQFKSKVFLEPSYMGLCKLATDSGAIKWVQAQCVYSNDEFIDNGAGEKPTHKYSPFASKEQRGEFVGVYCVAKTSEGDFLTTTMPKDEVLSIMERSEAVKAMRKGRGSGGPWVSDFHEQAKKTVIRRAFKTWPRSSGQMSAAVDISNNNEGFEPILTAPNAGQFTGDQKAYFDKLIENSDALGMHAFVHDIDETTRINLYHSFPKGEKGKYQKMVDALTESGFNMAADYRTMVEDATAQGDSAAIQELYEELGENYKHISLNPECFQFFEQSIGE